ncbi:hypothetical protein L1987_20748 [Smallanthus sonchifolius]|uniref:Uncharacterized protein n=1 Tax=Smallanthus sonchifolius TaxID=185202 RepID=A0ACB9ITN5_9ASTR|nr:hypothetical protein L1987_20748 [Smallanthus sonchifolius]
MYDSRIREFRETSTYAFQDKKHTITATVDGKPLIICIKTIQAHLRLADTKGKYYFLDADVKQTFRNMGYGKKHIIDAPSKKDVSLGTGESPNPIGKRLPSKATKSLKRKRSDTSVSSFQDEDIPPKPTSKGDYLTEELTARYQNLATYVSSIQTSVANIQQAQLVSMKVQMENNKLLKQILLSLAALTPSTMASNPARVATNATKKGENNIVRWFYDQEKKTIFIQREDGKIENLKAYNSQSSGSPRTFSALDKRWLLQNSLENAAEIPEAQEIQAKSKAEKAIPTKTSEDPHRIIPRTNMPLGLADELARRLQEQEDEVMRKESVERKIKKQVRKEQVVAQQNISTSQPSHPTELLKVKKEVVEQSKASSPHQSPTRIELSTPSPQ